MNSQSHQHIDFHLRRPLTSRQQARLERQKQEEQQQGQQQEQQAPQAPQVTQTQQAQQVPQAQKHLQPHLSRVRSVPLRTARLSRTKGAQQNMTAGHTSTMVPALNVSPPGSSSTTVHTHVPKQQPSVFSATAGNIPGNMSPHLDDQLGDIPHLDDLLRDTPKAAALVERLRARQQITRPTKEPSAAVDKADGYLKASPFSLPNHSQGSAELGRIRKDIAGLSLSKDTASSFRTRPTYIKKGTTAELLAV